MKTKDFAKICNTDKRTLFYYDEIELLKPESIKENGYRDYSIRQIADMDTIKILQACGYSLLEIKEIISKKDKEPYIIEGIKRLDKEIEKLIALRNYMKNKEKQYNEYLECYGVEGSYIDITYDKKAMEGFHFFSFIIDGIDSSSIYDLKEDKVYNLIQNKKGKYHKKGKGIRFFLTMNGSRNAINLIKNKVKDYPIDYEIFITPIPHLFLEKGTTVVEVEALLKE